MKKAYLFDFDGTLANSMPDWTGKVFHVLNQTHTPYPPDLIRQVVTLGDRGAAEYLRNTLGVPLETEEILRQMDAYALPKYRDEIRLKAGVTEYLSRLRQRGCEVHVLTASPHKMVDPCLKRTGIYDWFGHVWTCEDLALSKSQPEIYRKVMQLLELPISAGVFFDDSPLAIQAAARAGLFAVGVYDEASADYAGEMRRCADLYIQDFRQILNTDI